MTDAALYWNDFGADIDFDAGDIVRDDGLAPAVLISLFTDARVDDSSVLVEGETSLRGWWADFDETKPTGSLLWTVRRDKTLFETAEKAREYCRRALQWLIDEDIAVSVEVEAEVSGQQAVNIVIEITRGTAARHSALWEATEPYKNGVVRNTAYRINFRNEGE